MSPWIPNPWQEWYLSDGHSLMSLRVRELESELHETFPSSPFLNLVACLTTMRFSGLSLPIREQRRFEPLNNLAGVPNHPTYVELNLAYVNPNLAFPRSDRVRNTWEHSTPPSSTFARRVHILSPSLHAQCTCSRSRRGITRPGLPRAGVQYYKVSTQQAINGPVLNRHSWRHYFKTPFLKQVHRPVSSWNIIAIKVFHNNPSNFLVWKPI